MNASPALPPPPEIERDLPSERSGPAEVCGQDQGRVGGTAVVPDSRSGWFCPLYDFDLLDNGPHPISDPVPQRMPDVILQCGFQQFYLFGREVHGLGVLILRFFA